MRKSVISVLAAFAFAGAAAPAAAEGPADPVETFSVNVDFGDLDVATPAGAATLDKRIEAAASDVCHKPDDIRQLKQMAQWEACKASAKAGALEQISILEPYESLALASLF
jgi:UrcA family protein